MVPVILASGSPRRRELLQQMRLQFTVISPDVDESAPAMPPEELARVPDCGEGLEHRILRAAGGARTLEELYDLAKSRRYAHARIRRVVLRAFLGIDSIPERPPYLRVLGMTPRGQELLRAMRGLPVITKPAHGKGEPLLEAEARCTDLYALCFSTPRPAGMEWLKSPVIL